MTFTDDLNDLIRLNRGDTKRLRNIRDVIKHDNFITVIDKKYVESLITTYLKNQSIGDSEIILKPKTVVEPDDNVKPTEQKITLSTSSLFSGSNNKKLGILAGVAAAIALVVVIGFSTSMDLTDVTTANIIPSSNQQLIINIDESSYTTADIISISGSIKSADVTSVELSIENITGDKIWKEYVNVKNNGQFSTLIIAGGFGWDDSGAYVLKAQHDNLEDNIKFSFNT